LVLHMVLQFKKVHHYGSSPYPRNLLTRVLRKFSFFLLLLLTIAHCTATEGSEADITTI